MIDISVQGVFALLLVAAIVAMVARRLRLPYTVGLVLAGAGVAFSPIGSGVVLTKDLIFAAFLPPLIFEAAFHIPASKLRRDLPVILALVTVGLLLSSALAAVGMRYLAGWAWAMALPFGFLISATDPISVIAAFKEAGVESRLRLLAEGESLLNDATAAVAFGLALAATRAETVHAWGIAQAFVVTVIGGAVCGAVVGGVVLALAGRTRDHLVETTFTTVAAYGSFLLAERLHVSGVLATLTAGMLVGNLGALGAISARGREAVESLWEYLAFVVNSLVFLLIGITETKINFVSVLAPALWAILVVLASRGAAVYLCCAAFARTALRVRAREQHVLFWGGLRGALALALALGLPRNAAGREGVIGVAFAVVAFSVVVQGATMIPLLRRLGLLPQSEQPAASSR